MKSFFLVIICLFLLVEHSHTKEKREIPSEHIYGKLIGKRVYLDALVWHHGKGLSGHVLLPSGDSVYVKNSDIRKADGTLEPRLPDGKLVRLIGVLTYEHRLPSRGLEQGWPNGFSYFALDLESFTAIDRAEKAFPELNPK